MFIATKLTTFLKSNPHKLLLPFVLFTQKNKEDVTKREAVTK